MKLYSNVLASGGLFAISGLLVAQEPASTESHGDPFSPVGHLSVTPTVVQPGVQPVMTWGIDYPKSIPDLVVIDSAGAMTTINDKSDRLTVRVVGVSYNSEDSDLDVALWLRINNGSWDLVFYGSETEVDAGEAVYTQSIQPGTRVDFAVRGRTTEGSWSATQWTLAQSPNVDALINGDSLPAESSAFVTGQTESYVTQFVDSNNEVVAGPRDIIHLFEVGSTEPGDPYFDMQDIVVMSTYGKNNNGHGNNLDGVDVSNPGGGDGGPNGEVDQSEENPELWGGYVDDEKKWIKRK